MLQQKKKRPRIELTFYRAEIVFGFAQLRQMLGHQRDQVKNLSVDEIPKLAPSDSTVMIGSDYQDNLDYFKRYLESAISEYIIFAVDSLVERAFHELASFVKDFKEIPLSISDLRGEPVERAIRFVRDVAQIDVITPPDWQEVRGVMLLRNCYMHALGRLDLFTKRAELESFLKSHTADGSVEVGKGVVIISATFAQQTLDEIEKIIKKGIDNVSKALSPKTIDDALKGY
ncbi:MAG: hypothetical protein HRF44_00235 [Ignavibacterium sp.]|jgi:hypothetical protein